MPELRLLQVRLKERLARSWIDRAWLKRKAPVAGAVVGALVVCHLIVWFVMAHVAKGKVEQYLASHGDWVTASGIDIGGYPLHVEVHLSGVTAHQPHLEVSAPFVTVRMGLALAHAYSVATPRGVTVALDNHAVSAQLARLSLSGTSEEAPFGAATLRVGGLVLPDDTKADSLELSVMLPPQAPATETGQTARFTFDVSELTLPGRFGELGPTVRTVQLGGVVDGRLHAGQFRSSLATWRDGGGTVELRHAEVDWGVFNATGEGTLALDKDLQPQAAFTATVDGWQDLLQAMAESGVMKPDAARIVKFGLTLISSPDAGNAIKVPVNVQNGALYLEKAKIMQIPKVMWPADDAG